MPQKLVSRKLCSRKVLSWLVASQEDSSCIAGRVHQSSAERQHLFPLHVEDTGLTPNWVSSHWSSLSGWVSCECFLFEGMPALALQQGQGLNTKGLALPHLPRADTAGLSAEAGRSYLRHCWSCASQVKNQAWHQAPLLHAQWSHKASTCNRTRVQGA